MNSIHRYPGVAGPVLVALTALLPLRSLPAQTLSLRGALDRAERSAVSNRVARAEADAGRARAGATLQGILPTIRGEAGWMRTDDPLGAFGAILRQRSVTPAAFDPAALNDPTPRSDWSGAVVAEVPLVNADAWLARSGARLAAGAAAAQADWTARTVGLDVVRAYYGAVLAQAEVSTLDSAAAAAHAHVRQAEALAARGLVTRSDALLASVRAGEVDARLIEARSRALLAGRQLLVLVGGAADSSLALPDGLPAPSAIRALVQQPLGGSDRLDVAAADLAVGAARRDAARARLQFLPRINAFGRYDWHTPTALFGGTPGWTVGVMASWTPFSGLGELSAARASAANAAAATARAEGAAAAAALDQEARDADVQVATARLAIAEDAVAQGAEAHRIVARKYDGGLATVTELLDAAAAETATRLALAEASYQTIVAVAARFVAHGQTVAPMTALEN